MTQPSSFIDPDHSEHVCLLTKALYGLRQSFRAWFRKLTYVLITLGFVASTYDPSLFASHSLSHTIMILIYVDNIIFTGNNSSHLTHYISEVQTHFSLKDLGPLHFFRHLRQHYTYWSPSHSNQLSY
jgi:Reverse transcriptase (RNA-dependent DNA polymerase)